jgi:hypothetical protein
MEAYAGSQYHPRQPMDQRRINTGTPSAEAGGTDLPHEVQFATVGGGVMKFYGTLFLILSCLSAAAAQDAPQQTDSPPGLTVVKVKYERRRDDRDVRSSTSSDPGAFENTGVMPTGKTPIIYLYEYSAQLRNGSPKNIKWLYWAHVVSDGRTKLQLDRQEFVSFEKIFTNQKQTLVGRKRFSHVADYEQRKKDGPPLDERVEFICVGYGDGTLWHSPSVSESQCRETEKRRKP